MHLRTAFLDWKTGIHELSISAFLNYSKSAGDKKEHHTARSLFLFEPFSLIKIRKRHMGLSREPEHFSLIVYDQTASGGNTPINGL
jgi:hypothetical protein